MSTIHKFFEEKPVALRCAPFLLFLGLTFAQTAFGEEGRYWIYSGKTLVGAWMIWVLAPLIQELKWNFSLQGVIAGVAVFVIWVGLDPFYPKLSDEVNPWNPLTQFDNQALGWFFVVVRILGSSIVVPPLEEIFYRSFLYRYIVQQDFLKIPLSRFDLKAFVVTAMIFGFSHNQWLAGILCAFVYQGLVVRNNRLGDALTAHAVTNFLLGLWVVFKPAWHFW